MKILGIWTQVDLNISQENIGEASYSIGPDGKDLSERSWAVADSIAQK